ncbi:N-acetylmuramoyl-L-alanine amidase [hydrothermal vent metagenome]|uniref:N-acetylmuramoyl-L-alanine amidase n=1 Tax=hydrothermal vent metagenome TaxID=652676 RepID=A0A3B1AFQ9_9ZZZZ
MQSIYTKKTMFTLRLLLGILFLFVVASSSYATTFIEGVRMWQAPDNTRLVFDLSKRVTHDLFTMKSPNRIVIDLKDTNLIASLTGLKLKSDTVLRGVRTAKRNKNDLRIVLDLKKAVQPKSFVLLPNKDYGHRLVLDLFSKKSKHKSHKAKVKRYSPNKPRDVIIAIDAGHGGDDPGAIGYRGTKEKKIVLQVAKKLARKINRQKGMKAVLIRKGDYYVGLGKRVELARQDQADLFISLHADAFRTKKAKGSSVYVLSDNGASSEAAGWLANKENNSDLIGGVSLGDKDDLLKLVLVDMVKNSTLEDSHRVAKQVLRKLKGVNSLHKRHVEKAGFRVLKAPDMPSILIEMAFISNPKEESRLRSGRYQTKISKAILRGVQSYFKSNAPPGTKLALMKAKEHKISSGDTLSHIAKKYQVSIKGIRLANNLPNDKLTVGKILQIPVI